MEDFEVNDVRKAFYYTSLSYSDYRYLVKKRAKYGMFKFDEERISKLPKKHFTIF